MTLMIEPVFMRATRQGANFMVILVALIVIFKDKITSIISSAFSQIDDGAGTINDGISI